jgi:hypothetical protein
MPSSRIFELPIKFLGHQRREGDPDIDPDIAAVNIPWSYALHMHCIVIKQQSNTPL